MSWWGWTLIGILCVVGWGYYLWNAGRRIDGLHRRVLQLRLRLDRSLVRRASDALQLADCEQLSPEVAQTLRRAARKSLAQVGSNDSKNETVDLEVDSDRYLVESELTQALRDSLGHASADLEGDPFGAQLLESMHASGYRVRVLRVAHNQDVSHVREARSRLVTRVFHLAGKAPMPDYVDFDDEF